MEGGYIFLSHGGFALMRRWNLPPSHCIFIWTELIREFRAEKEGAEELSCVPFVCSMILCKYNMLGTCLKPLLATALSRLRLTSVWNCCMLQVWMLHSDVQYRNPNQAAWSATLGNVSLRNFCPDFLSHNWMNMGKWQRWFDRKSDLQRTSGIQDAGWQFNTLGCTPIRSVVCVCIETAKMESEQTWDSLSLEVGLV